MKALKPIATIQIGLMSMLVGCEPLIATSPTGPVSASGVQKAEVQVPTNALGVTVEQQNVRDRLLMDNKVGAIKHLYIISPESGVILLYSTVKGKVTSSGKRLTPRTVIATTDMPNDVRGFPVKIGSEQKYTGEVLQDDGTYGDSDPYIYWWDVRGVYHQHFMTGGQIVHLSDQPLRVNSNEIRINLEREHFAK